MFFMFSCSNNEELEETNNISEKEVVVEKGMNDDKKEKLDVNSSDDENEFDLNDYDTKQIITSYTEYSKWEEIDLENINRYGIKIFNFNWRHMRWVLIDKIGERYSAPWFMAVKLWDKWKVVFVWQDSPICDSIDEYGFSKEYIVWWWCVEIKK